MKRVKLGVWSGDIDMFKDGFIDFGLWQEVYQCCKQYGYKFIIENQDQFPINKDISKEKFQEFVYDFYKNHKTKDGKPFIPYEHQIEAIYQLLKYNYGILEIATAGGKSLVFGTLLFFYLKNVNPDAKFLLIVPNISLVTQFYNDLNDYNYGYNNDNLNPCTIRIDEVMSDNPRKYRVDEQKPNIYIGTYQSLEKYPREWFKQFDVVAADEAHTAKAQTLISILTKTFGCAKIRFGMSGTYPSPNSAEILTIQSLLGPKLINISAKQLMDKGLISTVKIKAILLHHDNHKFAEAVYNIKKRGDGQKAWLLEKEYVANSAKRKTFIKNLVDKFTSNSLILFHNLEYGTELFNFLKDNCQNKDIFYIDGETSIEKRDYIKNKMEDTSGNPKILIASFGTTSTGVNIKAITNIIFAQGFKSDQVIRQSIGRGLRLHSEKNKLIVFDIVDIFHESFKTTLWRQYESRRDDIYKKQKYPFDELKIKL
ncbi:DEAD/DEAH box helicase family protein [Candidatus Dojkabacteria bacterium]|nr:DEAD/DEAH box helicase family protein [Candidatus Dojkabacteria bacterium]